MRHNLILFLFLYSLCGFAQFYVQQINPLDLTIIKLFKKAPPHYVRIKTPYKHSLFEKPLQRDYKIYIQLITPP